MQKVVLLVEDHLDSREAMTFIIESFGYRVIAAENGLEALKLIAQEHIDLIFTDISMPVMDGTIAVKVMKQHKPISKVPIIAVTAHTNKYKDEILAAGVDEVVNKPVELHIIEDILLKYLGD